MHMFSDSISGFQTWICYLQFSIGLQNLKQCQKISSKFQIFLPILIPFFLLTHNIESETLSLGGPMPLDFAVSAGFSRIFKITKKIVKKSTFLKKFQIEVKCPPRSNHMKMLNIKYIFYEIYELFYIYLGASAGIMRLIYPHLSFFMCYYLSHSVVDDLSSLDLAGFGLLWNVESAGLRYYDRLFNHHWLFYYLHIFCKIATVTFLEFVQFFHFLILPFLFCLLDFLLYLLLLS